MDSDKLNVYTQTNNCLINSNNQHNQYFMQLYKNKITNINNKLREEIKKMKI
jgi:hypothetical protein